MNGHGTEPRPYKLDPEALPTVIQDDRLYYLYTDALVLIHDLVCEYSPEQERPRFTADEIEKQIASIQDQLNRHVADMPVLENPVSGNITQNYRLAWDIRHFAERNKSADDRFETERAATQFARGILQIYTTIRTLKRANQPMTG